MNKSRLVAVFRDCGCTFAFLHYLSERPTRHALAGLAILATAALLPSITQAQLDDPIPEPIPASDVAVKLETVATGLTAPNWGTFAPGDPSRLFVTDQDGILWAIDLATGDKTAFLDVRERLVALGVSGPGTFDERGFLGVAFHPFYRVNGLVYTYTSEPTSGMADFPVPVTEPPATPPNHESVIIEWQVPKPTDPTSVADPTSARVLLRIEQPQFNHDAGGLNFGPGDMLYISLGDGGAADDEGPGHVAQGNGQDPSNVLGAILRIDPTGENSANGQYGVPTANPFFPGDKDGPFGGEAGCADGFCDELFAFGFRNPFRFSFDRTLGDLYAADVGQNNIEEIDVVVAGGNYGWRIKEGSFCFDTGMSGPGGGFVKPADACDAEGLIDPVAEYDHDEGIAIVGGFVYRGYNIPGLRGRYIFGDFAGTSGDSGRLFALNEKNIVKQDGVETTEIVELQLADRERLGLSLLGFGQDALGELYVLVNGTGVPFPDPEMGPTGMVLRIERAG